MKLKDYGVWTVIGLPTEKPPITKRLMGIISDKEAKKLIPNARYVQYYLHGKRLSKIKAEKWLNRYHETK